MIEPDKVKRRIQEHIEGALVQVMDMTGGQDHFRVVVISEAFEGLPMVKQHQKVYDALGDAFEGGDQADIHALGLKTYTPEEWEDMTGSG